MKNFKERLGHEILISDGGMGSLLQARGLMGGELPESWNIEKPDVILDIQKDYIAAGCDILTTNTFGANGGKIHDYKYSIAELVDAGVSLARKAADGKAYVALDLGPTGHLLKPYGDLPFEAAYKYYAEEIKAGSGADIVLIETMGDTLEVKAAVLAAKENCNLPIVVTCAFDASGKILTGGTIESVVALLESLGVDALGMNCGLGPGPMTALYPRLVASATLPISINANAGLPVSVNGKACYSVGAIEFADYAEKLYSGGVSMIGGCCGTTPAHIAELSRRFKGKSVVPHVCEKRTIVSSATKVVSFGNKPILVGERINPTGKPKMKAALRNSDFEFLCREAISQTDRGAEVLDVNVGLPGIDEATVLEKTVTQIQSVSDAPLQIDTADTSALAKALRIYNGKPLVNSVNGKESSLSTVLPLVKKYGAAVVALTLDENGIPATFEGRVKIAEKIIRVAESYGIDRRDILIDTLTMTVSTGSENAATTLDALQSVRERFGVNTILGVSNISFGLPSREVITAAFFTMALQRGLSAGIVNPLSTPLMNAYRSFCALSGYDTGCKEYIAALANSDTSPVETTDVAGMSLHDAVSRGLREEAARRTESLLMEMPPLEIINKELVPALDEVGIGFEKGTLFLPQLLMSADAAKDSFAIIRDKLSASGETSDSKGKIVIATVKGDVHDIGKNIVKVLLENYGFDVVDLGKDVDPEVIVNAAVRENVCLVGLSALMTTTVPAMAETIRLLREKHPCKVMVGGAVLTADYAAEIGADFYSKDAMGDVRYAEQVFANKI